MSVFKGNVRDVVFQNWSFTVSDDGITFESDLTLNELGLENHQDLQVELVDGCVKLRKKNPLQTDLDLV